MKNNKLNRANTYLSIADTHGETKAEANAAAARSTARYCQVQRSCA